MNQYEKSLPERIAVLELKVANLSEDFSSLATQMREETKSIEGKLNELLALKARGMGAFWLASSLLGTGIVGFLVAALNWLREAYG